jgi:hypothetical protein
MRNGGHDLKKTTTGKWFTSSVGDQARDLRFPESKKFFYL